VRHLHRLQDWPTGRDLREQGRRFLEWRDRKCRPLKKRNSGAGRKPFPAGEAARLQEALRRALARKAIEGNVTHGAASAWLRRHAKAKASNATLYRHVTLVVLGRRHFSK
jgi:hypothetical protein